MEGEVMLKGGREVLSVCVWVCVGVSKWEERY